MVCNIAGNVWTATTHIITVVVGAGVLALPWAMAQLGWIAGIASIIIFACISAFTYSLVADCYRYPDPVTGKRNYTYMQAVRSYLGILFYSYIHTQEKTTKFCVVRMCAVRQFVPFWYMHTSKYMRHILATRASRCPLYSSRIDGLHWYCMWKNS